jgi:hypothetical protein
MPKQLTQQEATEKAVNTHGDRYDLSRLVYSRSKDLVTIGCKVHGWFNICYRDFTSSIDAAGCQTCSKEVYLSRKVAWNKASVEDALKKMTSKYGDQFTYDMSNFQSCTEKVGITCRTHGEFQMSPHQHIAIHYGCAECGKKASADNRKTGKTGNMAKAINLHDDVYDYSLVPEGVGSKVKINIICQSHGVFTKTWNEHLKGSAKGGCPTCARERLAAELRSNTEEFLAKIPSDRLSLYDYSKVEYVNSKEKVEIICCEHGTFWQNPNKHLSGRGCPKCAKNGFMATKPANFYILSSDSCVKVGITNRKVKDRVTDLNGNGSIRFEIVDSYYFEDGSKCMKIESAVLEKLANRYAKIDARFNGSSECFVGAKTDDVLSIVRHVIEELNG